MTIYEPGTGRRRTRRHASRRDHQDGARVPDRARPRHRQVRLLRPRAAGPEGPAPAASPCRSTCSSPTPSARRWSTDKVKVDVDVALDKPIGYFSIVRTVTFTDARRLAPRRVRGLRRLRPRHARRRLAGPPRQWRQPAHGRVSGGWGGIRTPGEREPTPVFKTGALNHSATHPSLRMRRLAQAGGRDHRRYRRAVARRRAGAGGAAAALLAGPGGSRAIRPMSVSQPPLTCPHVRDRDHRGVPPPRRPGASATEVAGRTCFICLVARAQRLSRHAARAIWCRPGAGNVRESNRFDPDREANRGSFLPGGRGSSWHSDRVCRGAAGRPSAGLCAAMRRSAGRLQWRCAGAP